MNNIDNRRQFYVRHAPHGNDGNLVRPIPWNFMTDLNRNDPFDEWEAMPRTLTNVQRACELIEEYLPPFNKIAGLLLQYKADEQKLRNEIREFRQSPKNRRKTRAQRMQYDENKQQLNDTRWLIMAREREVTAISQHLEAMHNFIQVEYVLVEELRYIYF
jgi:hypothetical protein